MWIQILRNKYLTSKTLAQATIRHNDSPFWKGLMRIKINFFKRAKFILGDGTSTRFWEDTWLGDSPLALQYPMLYNITQRKQDYVSTVLQSIPINMHFRRALVGARWEAWTHLVRRLMQVQLSDQSDSVRWTLTVNGVFSVKSMYTDLVNSGPLARSLHIWDIKVPLKIKVFMWFLHKGVVLTKDNLIKRSWRGRSNCCYCDQNETIRHLFLDCPLAKLLWRTIHIAFNVIPPTCINSMFTTWLNGVDVQLSRLIRIGICALLWAIWNTRNDIIFNGQKFTNFLQVIFRATSWIRTWSSLSLVDNRELMGIGCNRWETAARVIFNRFG
uniref:Reverse transcriptase zinc-binding domain-containing protein n=1 Tax=Hordeum vulgare subsp. vulgare TaxID=112509 RepID=A0A8I6WC46_HORVV